jgi:hypothetical protein
MMRNRASLFAVSNGWSPSSSTTTTAGQQRNSPQRQPPSFLSSSTSTADLSLEKPRVATSNETSSSSPGATVVESTAISEGSSGDTAAPIRLPPPIEIILAVYQDYRVFWMTCLAIAASTWLTSGLALRSSLLHMRRNILAGTMIFTVGDFGAQVLTHWSSTTDKTTAKKFQLDAQRLQISTVLGILWAGLSVPFVYSSIEGLLPGSSSIGRVLLKMVISCSILSTAGNYVTMFFRRYVASLCDIIVAGRRRRNNNKLCKTSVDV